MTNQMLTHQEKMIRQLSLRVGIERYLTTRWRYMTEVRGNFRNVTDEEFEATIAEMTKEGLLTQTLGRKGGTIVTVNNGVENKEAANE